MSPRVVRADLLLLLTAAIWGFAFVAQSAGMKHVGPFTFNGIRFALGALTLLPLLIRRRAEPATTPTGAAELFRGGLLAGAVLFCGASLQQVGLLHTTAANAGFITGLYVVFVPLLGLLWRRQIGSAGWAGTALAAAGLYLLSIRGGLRLQPGDGLELAGAVFWAVHVLVIARWSRRVPAVQLAFVQFVVCAAASLVAAIITEPIALAQIRAAALPILYAGVLSVGVAYTLQVVAQREAPPTAAAILLSLEAVFAAIGGWWLLAERLDARSLFGCALMLAGVLTSQLGRAARSSEQGVDSKGNFKTS